ncbi:type I-E CRISPR-associated protein Cas5/CasD [Yinghuangia aomiensis]
MAAALGHRRGDVAPEFDDLRFTIRVDRPGTLLRDLHTVGGGMPRHLTVPTAEGKRRSPETATVLTYRYYLQDAAFTVAVSSRTGEGRRLAEYATALRKPVWPPYLGRRSCPPSGPVLMAECGGDPHELLLALPLARPAPSTRRQKEVGAVEVEFVSDGSPGKLFEGRVGDVVTTSANDEPRSFDPMQRRYRERPVYRFSVPLPAAQCVGVGTAFLTAAADHLGLPTVNDTDLAQEARQ